MSLGEPVRHAVVERMLWAISSLEQRPQHGDGLIEPFPAFVEGNA
jgi:hypothetical protein